MTKTRAEQIHEEVGVRIAPLLYGKPLEKEAEYRFSPGELAKYLAKLEEAIIYLAQELGSETHAMYDHKRTVLDILELKEDPLPTNEEKT